LQPGVVESNRGLSIRGGRIGEAIIYVDGVPVRSVSGRTGTGVAASMGMVAAGGGIGNNVVGTNGVEEVSITTGAMSRRVRRLRGSTYVAVSCLQPE
jgi:hypothetical protein